MTDKVPLILVTGGTDSTWLLREQLGAKGPCDILYACGGQDDLKRTKEMETIPRIIAFLEKKFEHKVRNTYFVGNITETDQYLHKEYPQGLLDQRGNRRYASTSNILYPAKLGNSQQPLAWLLAIYRYASRDIHSEVQIGYNLTDSIRPFLDRVTNAWNAISQLNDVFDDGYVPITFPLSRWRKDQIIGSLKETPGLYEMTWSCEMPKYYRGIHQIGACGECRPCIDREYYTAKDGDTIVKRTDRAHNKLWEDRDAYMRESNRIAELKRELRLKSYDQDPSQCTTTNPTP